MKTVFKYSIAPYDLIETGNEIDMIDNAEPLCMQIQGPDVQVWAKVEITPGKISRKALFKFLVLGTGQAIPAGNWTYLNTVQVGPLVWHFFWRKP